MPYLQDLSPPLKASTSSEGISIRREPSSRFSANVDRSARDNRARRFVSPRDGTQIAYFEAGSGPDLVLVHGALMNADDMRLRPMAGLAEHFHVVAFDRPGHGLSPRIRTGDASLWRQMEFLREAAAALGLVQPVVVGHSLGGAIALA